MNDVAVTSVSDLSALPESYLSSEHHWQSSVEFIAINKLILLPYNLFPYDRKRRGLYSYYGVNLGVGRKRVEV